MDLHGHFLNGDAADPRPGRETGQKRSSRRTGSIGESIWFLAASVPSITTSVSALSLTSGCIKTQCAETLQ